MATKMKTLCYITGVISEQVVRGQFAGKDTNYRLGIGCNPMGWEIFKEVIKPDGTCFPPMGLSYPHKFEILLYALLSKGLYIWHNENEVIRIIVQSLEKLTDKKFNFELDKDTQTMYPMDDLSRGKSYAEKVGKAIDDCFNVNQLAVGTELGHVYKTLWPLSAKEIKDLEKEI